LKETMEITDLETEHLVWIHSNKFTTPELFHKKFMPNQSSRNAYKILKKYVNPERELLHVLKTPVGNSNLFFLTAGALRSLDENNKILVRSNKYPVKINNHEKEHDLMVQTARIRFESFEELKDIFWVSDFEMRSGITPSIKAEYLEGKLNKERWRSNGANPNPKGRRTPDGYFEADIEDRRISFAFELENHHYNDVILQRMTENLRGGFPHALKLIVSATPGNAVRMIRSLQSRIKPEEQKQWFVSDFERVTNKPFKKCWHQLNHPLVD
jgi:hypothetical protein